MATIVSGSALAQRNWYEPYKKALDAMAAHRWPEAVEQIGNALRMDKNAGQNKTYEGTTGIADYFPYFIRGLAYKEMREYEKADKDLTLAAKTKMSTAQMKELDTARAQVAVALRPAPGPTSSPTPNPTTRTTPPPGPTSNPVAPGFTAKTKTAQSALAQRNYADAIDLFEELKKLDSTAFASANLGSALAEAQRGRAAELMTLGQQRLKDNKISDAKARFTEANGLVSGIARNELADIDRRERDYQTNKAAGEQKKANGQFADALRSYALAKDAQPELYAADGLAARVDELNRLSATPTPGPPPPPDNGPATARGHVSKAQAAIRSHNYAEAARYFALAAERDPKNTDAITWLDRTKKYEDSKQKGRDLETKDPDGALTALKDAKDFDNDRFAFDKLNVVVDRISAVMRKVDPTPAPIFGPLHDALVAYLSGEVDKAITILEGPAGDDKTLDPQTRADVHAYLGVAYGDRSFRARGDDDRRKFREQALQQFKLALKDKPDYVLSYRLGPQVQKLLTEAKGK